MDIQAVRDELGQALQAIGTLHVFTYEPSGITPPAAVVGWPDRIDFDAAMERGADRAAWDVFVFVGMGDRRSASENLAPYLDGSGPSSVKAALESYSEDSPKFFDTLRVQSVEVDGYIYGSVTYLGARFTVDIIGAGED